MKYLLSTIADVDFDPDSGDGKIYYVERTSAAALEYGIGMELAEFCISDNLDDGITRILPHFEKNRKLASTAVLHAPYNELYPHAIDGHAAAVARERYDFTWELCKKYGIDKIVVHPNYVPSLYYPEWFTARQVEFWSEFFRDHTENITVCLENVMEPYPELITDIIDKAGDKRLRMCLDAGHANLTKISPEQWLEKCSEYISHYHIHNNNGPADDERPGIGDTHSAPGNGTIDMRQFLEKAEKLTPDATAAIECMDVSKSALWLKNNGLIQENSHE